MFVLVTAYILFYKLSSYPFSEKRNFSVFVSMRIVDKNFQERTYYVLTMIQINWWHPSGPFNPIKHIAIAKYFQNPNFVKEVEKYS